MRKRRAQNDPCPACGTWVCARCGWKRRLANRAGKQDCPKCGSELGTMLDVHHVGYRAQDHLLEYEARGVTDA